MENLINNMVELAKQVKEIENDLLSLKKQKEDIEKCISNLEHLARESSLFK